MEAEVAEDNFMTLENQLVSLELSKKLKELGVKQESLFSWVIGVNFGQTETEKKNFKPWVINDQAVRIPEYNYIPAFTVAELGELLPNGYVTGHTQFKDEKTWCCHWYRINKDGVAKNIGDPLYDQPIFAETEANARAKMLIYLLENKLV